MKIIVFETPEELALAAAERFVTHAHEAVNKHGLFTVALSGGSTPRRTYELLASESFQGRVEWSKVHLFFGDERTVASDHPDSNYRQANETLISRVPVPPSNVHPMQGSGDPAANARSYEVELKRFLPEKDWPRFDVVFLGMGKDGHTASLFPGTEALRETHAWVVCNWVPQQSTYRITLTAPAINAAENVVFMVSGSDKAEALALVIEGPRDAERFPAQLVHPQKGSLTWLIDAEAACGLTKRFSRRAN